MTAQQIEVVPGKWYVVDRYATDHSGIVAGPFDTKAEAEQERLQLNIADDCLVGRKR